MAAAGLVAAGALIVAGGPVTVVERAVDSFTEPLPAGEGDLQRRLLSVSGNGRGDYWHVAWQMAREEPLHGAGAGSFEAAGCWSARSRFTLAMRTTSTSRRSPSSELWDWPSSLPR